MTFVWTDAFREPLASLARDRDWERVEEASDGRWLLLAAGTDGVGWYRSSKNGRSLLAMEVHRDERLPHVRTVLQDWARDGLETQLLAWRPGRRAVFRVVHGETSRICKLYRRDRQVLLRWTALPSAKADAWRVPRVLDWDPDRRLLTLEDCPGPSLHQRWLEGAGEPGDGETVARLLAWIGATPAPEELPTHGTEEEIAVLEKQLAVLERARGTPLPEARVMLERIATELRRGPEGRPVLCHRDLHDKQLLCDGDGGSLIDLDLAARGPAALDVGNILAHVRLRELRGIDLPWTGIATRVAEAAVPARRIEDSVRPWTAAALFRLCLIYSRRRRSPGLCRGLLGSADEALRGAGSWEAVL